jgi:hypothetical protein
MGLIAQLHVAMELSGWMGKDDLSLRFLCCKLKHDKVILAMSDRDLVVVDSCIR